MNFIRFAAIAALTAALASAQDKARENPKPEATIIPVKTLSGDSFERLVKLINVFGLPMSFDSKLRTIIVYATRDRAEEVRRVVEQLDRPNSEAAIGRNIEVTLTLLRCSLKPAAESKPLPADLEGVAKQLRAVTQYKEIQLWDIVPLHAQEGRVTEQSSRLPSLMADTGGNAVAQIKIRPESVQRRDNGRFVRFEDLRVGFRMPYRTGPGQFNFIDVGLNTAGDFKEGQKTVVGKVSTVDDEGAIFVVVSLKVLD